MSGVGTLLAIVLFAATIAWSAARGASAPPKRAL
jgi:hypothetical protein